MTRNTGGAGVRHHLMNGGGTPNRIAVLHLAPMERRARSQSVEPIQRKRDRVGLVKRERIARLRIDVYADNLKPGAMQSHRNPTRPAK
jgi:hypothetical protein